MTTGTIYVQPAPDGSWLADVAELPGAVARDATRDGAVAKVRRAFSDFLALLEQRGLSTEHWQGLDPDSFEVREPATPFIFDEDFAPMQEHELRDRLHHLEALRGATLGLVRGLSATDVETQPTEGTWSIRETLEHVMLTEAALLAKLEKWPDAEGELPTFQAVHRIAFQRFTVMDPEDTALDHEVMGRRWSTRRVLRRILEHELEHQGQVREILAALGGRRAPE